jgi:hypothetical protein
MKDACYDVEVAFTKNELVCCKCNCKAGCDGIERGVCVHILPLVLLFLIFLLNGFVEHILVEFCHRWDLDHMNIEDGMSTEKKKSILHSILNMMSSCGIDTSNLTNILNTE